MNRVEDAPGIIDRIIRFCLENKLVVVLLALFLISWGVLVAPFDWNVGALTRSPVPVDAIPDLGENQQIVFTEWMGRSPQDVEDQVTYPLTVQLLGIPDVKTIRCYSMFGFSTIYVIFKEKVDFYWSRSRILEKLNSLPAEPVARRGESGARPRRHRHGTDLLVHTRGTRRRRARRWVAGTRTSFARSRIATSVTRCSRPTASPRSRPSGDSQQEYQVDVDPDAMRAFGVTLPRSSRLCVGPTSTLAPARSR